MPLDRRVMPSVPLSIEIDNGDGTKIVFGRQLAINYNVLADAQEKCGYNFLGGLLDWVDDPARIRALLWASLLPHQPDLRNDEDFQTIGEYLDGSNRAVVLEALFKAFSLYLHKDKRKKFDEATSQILIFLRTGEAPKEASAERPLAEATKTEIHSDGKNSESSPVTTLAS